MVRRRRVSSSERVIASQWLCALLWSMIHITLACDAASFQVAFFRRLIGTGVCLLLFALASNRAYRKQVIIGESILLVITLLVYLGQRDVISGLWDNIIRGWFLDHWEIVLEHDGNRLYVNLFIMIFFSSLGWWGHEKSLKHGLLTIEVVCLVIGMTVYQQVLAQYVMICFLCYVLMVLTKVMFLLRYGKQGADCCKEVLIFVFPIYLLLSMICMNLPMKKAPLQWKWVADVKNEISHVGNHLGTTKLYDLFIEQFQSLEDYVNEKGEDYGVPLAELDLGLDDYQVDFEDRKYTGEAITYSDQELFRIEVDKDIQQTIYLAGDEKAYYEGSAWMHEEKESGIENDPAYDAMELIYGLAYLGIDDWQNAIITNEIKVHYDKINTRLLFYPRSTWRIADQKPFEIQKNENGRMEWMIRTEEERSYTALYYDVNSEGGRFRSWMEAIDGFSYLNDMTDVTAYAKKQRLILPDFFKEMSNDEIRNALEMRAKENKKRYIQLPEDFPSRISNLAAEITEGAETDYEKVMLLNQYLQSGSYTYTRTPALVPDDQDFVDYFLFISPSGYCSHYASALVLMARSIGVPARYIEGYAVLPSAKKTCSVKDSSAHAWAEIYIEGFGWVTVEATPAGYVTRNEQGAENIIAPEEIKEDIEAKTEDEAAKEQAEESLTKEIMSTQEIETAYPEVTPIPSEIASEMIGAQGEDGEKNSLFSRFPIVLVGGILGLLVGALLLGKWLIEWVEARRSVREQYIYYFNRVYQQITKQGYGRQEKEGLTHYLERLNEELPHELKGFIRLYGIYMDERYGNIPFEKAHVSQIIAFKQKMRKMKKPIRKQDEHGRKKN